MLIVRETAKKGLGVFTTRNVSSHDILLQFKGDIVIEDDIIPSLDHLYLQIGKNKYIGPSNKLDDNINHSCDPNCMILILGFSAYLGSDKYIDAGDEITFDYSSTSTECFPKMNCYCESFNCRKQIGCFNTIPDKAKHIVNAPKYLRKFICNCKNQLPPPLGGGLCLNPKGCAHWKA